MSKEDSDDEYYTEMLTKEKIGRLRKRSKIEDYDFVRTWQTSKSTREIAEKLSVSRGYVLRRGRKLRFNGVPLRRFPLEEVDEDLG